MRVPDPLPCGFGLVLKFLPFVVFFGGLSLAFLEFRPAVFQELCRYIDAPNFYVTDVARDVVIGWKRMDRSKSGLLSDCQSTEEFARFKGPWLRKLEVFQCWHDNNPAPRHPEQRFQHEAR